MDLIKSLNMNKPYSLLPFMLGSLLFLLYGILNIIDMNEYILNFNVIDIDQITRSGIIYAYLAGYYIFILKVIIALLTLFILTLIIRIIVATITSIFISRAQEGGADQIKYMASNKFKQHLHETICANMKWLLSFIINETFIILFLVIIPLFLLFVLLAYSHFYNKENIKNENQSEAPKIMLTNHNFLVYLIFSIFIVTFIYSVYIWFSETFK